MKRLRTNTAPWQIASGIFMVLALLWLSVSTPFVYQSQQQLAAQKHTSSSASDNNPFSNTTEEKSESGVNTISEYLHEVHSLEHLPLVVAVYYKCHPSELYFAYHPELLSPPPEA